MSAINRALRSKILEVMAGESLTSAQIASRIPHATEYGVQSALMGMRKARQVRRGTDRKDSSSGDYRPALWSRA